MNRAAIYTALIIVSIVTLGFLDTTEHQLLSGLLIGLAAGFAIPVIDTVIVNSRYLKIAVSALRYYNQDVRVSASYLFRIEDRGRYLLVRGKRYRDQFQPVGGVYKLSPTAKTLLKQWRARTDELIPADEVSEGDLRLIIPGRHLLAFLHWYEKGQGRETSPWREFFEELISPGILPRSAFPYVHHDFVTRHINPIRFSDYARRPELLIADIVELVPNDTQLEHLRRTQSLSSNDVVWATADQIMRRGARPGIAHKYNIAITAEWTL